MTKTRQKICSLLLGLVMAVALIFGITFTLPTNVAKAETLSTTGWTLAREGDYEFRIQNGNTYWKNYTNGVTTASMLDYTEINGITLSQINAEKPGSITVTLQPAGGSIGSFYRISINPEIAGFTVNDIGTVVVKAGWSHTDANGTYTIDTDLYFAHGQNKWSSDNNNWKYIPVSNVVDISDSLQLADQGIQATGTRAILIKTSDNNYWSGDPITPNEGGGAFLNMLYINGTSVKEWNNKAHAALEAGEITDISYGSDFWLIDNGPTYAPIAMSNSAYISGLGSISQVWIPTDYISNVSSFKVAKGFANLQGDTLYYVSKDVEYARSGNDFVKVASSVDISDAFKLLVQDYTASDGTMLYYLHTNNTQYWTQQYGSTGAYSINEKEWKGVTDSSLQGGAVQMSYLEFNGTPIYDINGSDNGAYGATQGNIASGGKYAPILAFLTPEELGNSIKLQIPSKYPSNGGAAADNHQTLTIKKGFFVVDTATNIKYEVTRDIQWDYQDGAWVEHITKIETTVEDARLFGSSADVFAGVKLVGSDYAAASNTYAGTVKTAKEFAQSANFLSHVLIDDAPLSKPGEAFLNVWGNYGYFTFRPGNNSATKITILAGCQFPTYNALFTGAKEVYVTTEDVTFVKQGDNWVKDEGVKTYNVTFTVDGATHATQEVEEGSLATRPEAPTKTDSTYTYTFDKWLLDGVEYDFATPVASDITLVASFTKTLKAGEYATSIKSVVYARDNKNNWMMIRLSEKDYPAPGEVFNFSTNENQILALNLYDKIVVDGYTLRSRVNSKGTIEEVPKINLWQADCLGIRIPGAAGALDGAQRITIRAGAQFPSYAYVTEGVEAYFVTTEEITFVNVGNESGAWEREYTATFVADGEVIATIPYLASKGFTAPAVPEKAGLKGEWESYTANGNIIVNAVYTERTLDYEYTNISAVKDQDGFLILTLTNEDYPSLNTWWGPNGADAKEVLNAMKALNFHVYGADGQEIKLGGDAIIKVWGGIDNDLAFYLNGYGSSNMPTTVTFKKGCEFPSYAYVNNGTPLCFELVEDVTFNKVDGVWVRTTDLPTEEGGATIPNDFADRYVLSDLYKVGYNKTSVFQDGFESWNNEEGEASYRYGYVSTSFALSFDFKFEGATFYETFNINLGTEGYQGNKYHFGWRFYLLRGDTNATTQNICVEYFSNTSTHKGNIPNSANTVLGDKPFVEGQIYHITIGYKLVNAATGEVLIYTAVNDYSRTDTYTLGGDFVTFGSYANSLTMNAITKGTVNVCNPYEEMTKDRYTLLLDDGSDLLQEVVSNKVVLPALNAADYNMGGNVFVGWTTNTETLEKLYPAGYELTLTADTTLYPVWIGFAMQNGASVRKAAPSGIRFSVDVDRNAYDFGVDKKIITEMGTILCPTSYLTGRELTHELGAGYFTAIKMNVWKANNKTYSAAFVNLSAEQYARSFSARGYMKIQYTSGVGYIYTAYDANEHARSMYEVATAAVKASEITNDIDYVNLVADITINASKIASKNTNAVGKYNVSASTNGNAITVTVNNGVKVKTALINGVRVVMGYDAQIVVDGGYYKLSEYTLTGDGLTFSFTLNQDGNSDQLMKKYHLSVIQGYLDSDAYTAEHKAYIVTYIEGQELISLINKSETVDDYIKTYDETVEELEMVKTAAEVVANNMGNSSLASPVLSKGLGYTVTWNTVGNADYYIVHDDNDYRDYVVFENMGANAVYTYEAEVVGNHNITVTAHSYNEEYNSATSNVVATPEVKPVFSYKSMQDGLYKFSKSQMSTMGISTSGCYYDSSDKKYFVYYNKDTGWSPYPIYATDWTSPEEFPAHAQRLKDMGNNIILVARDTNAEYKEGDTWAASRLRYVMDTAWSMGMKVLVCDEVFYKLSMSDNSGTGATSKAQVTTAINNRSGFADYVTHPAFYGFSLDDEPYGKYLSAMSYTISALDDACEALGVSDPFYLACLFQAQGGELGTELYVTQSSLKEYYNKWLAIDGVDDYLYVDIYTQHAMDQPTNRYNTSFEVVYDESYLGGNYKFYQAITAHTQNDGVLLEQDLYMSLLYAAAHNVAGYSWFCYFPIAGELAGTLGGYDGNGYGNGIGNNVEKGKCFYNAAKTAAYQYEILQGLLDGYEWKTRNHNDSENLLTTTLSNGTKTATMYVNADVDSMSGSVTVTASGSECYLIGYNVGTAETPYQAVSGSVTLAPGQAVICIS